jgi:hypothetical protein
VGKSQPKLVGKTQPRVSTPPLRQLRRETSAGYAFAEFCDLIGEPLLPWQRWLAIHALELTRDGSFRFRIVIVLVARQNGKTQWARLLALFRLYVTGARLVLGTAQDLSMSRETQAGCIEIIEASPYLAEDLAEVRRAAGDESFRVAGEITYDDAEGDESFTLTAGGRYKIAAPSRRAGRGLSVDLLYIDELREWRSTAPWSAMSKTTSARANGLIVATTNAGDDESVVLNQLHDAALSGRDDSIGVFEWSAVPNCELDDRAGWQAANPGLGYTVSEASIGTAMISDRPEDFRTEVLCQRVPRLDGAIDVGAWQACHDPAGDMTAYAGRLAACFDISPDGQHCTLAVAAKLPDGRARVKIAGAWKSTDTARAQLPALLAEIRPQVVAWYPAGPAGAFATVLRPAAPGSRGPEYAELTGTRVAQVCMELADLVRSRAILHAGEEILDGQVRGATRITAADGWRFGRKGEAHVDAAYAAAGAISAALTMPEPRRAAIRIIEAS